MLTLFRYANQGEEGKKTKRRTCFRGADSAEGWHHVGAVTDVNVPENALKGLVNWNFSEFPDYPKCYLGGKPDYRVTRARWPASSCWQKALLYETQRLTDVSSRSTSSERSLRPNARNISRFYTFGVLLSTSTSHTTRFFINLLLSTVECSLQMGIWTNLILSVQVGVPYSWGGRGESNRSPPRPVPSEVALETAALATPSPMPALQMDHHSQSLPGDHSST